MEIPRRFIDVTSQGHRIRTSLLAAGERGPTVILLHGGGTDSASLSWRLAIPALAECRRVIAFDWPGFGESERSLPVPFTIEFIVQFLHDLMDTLQIERASLAGLSMGGGAALGFTLRWPERVHKLVLVDSYGLQPELDHHKWYYLYMKIPYVNELAWASMRSRAMTRWMLKALLRRPNAMTEDLEEEVHQELNHPGGHEAWFNFQKHEMTWNGQRTCFLDRLGEITAPALIIHGTEDTSVPVEYAQKAHERIRGSRLHWMEGCGHWPQRDNPAEFNRVISEFLADED